MKMSYHDTQMVCAHDIFGHILYLGTCEINYQEVILTPHDSVLTYLDEERSVLYDASEQHI